MSRPRRIEPNEVPHRLDDALSPSWLSSVLPGERIVDGVEVSSVTHGSATHAAATVRFDDGDGLSIYVKGSFETDRAHDSMKEAGLYLREAHAYLDLLPTVDVRTPQCFAAGFDATSGHGVMIMADLNDNGGRPGSALRPYGVDVAAMMLEQMARLHSRYSNSPEARALPTLADISAGLAQGGLDFYNGTERWLSKAFDRRFTHGAPSGVRDAKRLSTAVERFVASTDDPSLQTVLHGDPHIGNTYVAADGRPGLFDFQTIQRGPWAADVAYFLVSSLSVDDRRNHFRDLVAEYRRMLTAAGANVLADDAMWLQAQTATLLGYHVWVLSGYMQRYEDPEDDGPVKQVGAARGSDTGDSYGFGWNFEVGSTYVERFGSAVEDYAVI